MQHLILLISDCHEVHLTGNLGDTYTRHQAVIEYSDDERKSYDVLCKHESSHIDHDLIDNHISTDPNEPQRQRRETAGMNPLDTQSFNPVQPLKSVLISIS